MHVPDGVLARNSAVRQMRERSVRVETQTVTRNFCARVRAPHEERARDGFSAKVHSACILKLREKSRLNFQFFYTVRCCSDVQVWQSANCAGTLKIHL